MIILIFTGRQQAVFGHKLLAHTVNVRALICMALEAALHLLLLLFCSFVEQ